MTTENPNGGHGFVRNGAWGCLTVYPRRPEGLRG